MTKAEKRVIKAAMRWSKAREAFEQALNDDEGHAGSPREHADEQLQVDDRILSEACAALAKERKK